MNSDLYKPYDIHKTHPDPERLAETTPLRACEVIERRRNRTFLENIEYVRTSIEKIRVQCVLCAKIIS